MADARAGTAWTIQDLLKVATQYLKEKGIDSPRLSAELLLSCQLNISRIQLYLDFDRPLTEEETAGYRGLIKRRVLREPIQYITGNQEFWSMQFRVTPEVLIPRPESEILIEQVLALKHEGLLPEREPLQVLDIGTGSGCLAVSIAKEFVNAHLWATDVSREALDLAMANARAHGVEERIAFRRGDTWEALGRGETSFDVILSNPPYVASEAIPGLAPEIRDYEPRSALDGGDEGLFYIEKILVGADAFLAPGGWLLVEMDPEQIPKAAEIMQGTGHYREERRVKDYGRRYRVLACRRR